MKISFKEIPGVTSLFLDYLYNFKKVEHFYAFAPFEESTYQGLFKKLSERAYDRDLLADVLKRQNAFWGNTEYTINSIDLLRKNSTFVIFTGQQAGLFGGPLYTLYKAMTAINLARYLTMTSQHQFLPMFWIEGEDHDFAEIQSTYVIDKNNDLLKLTYEPKVPFEGGAAGAVLLDEGINDVIELYAGSIHNSDFKAEFIKALRQCYSPGSTMSEAFARWMSYLLGRYGLIIVDPSDAELKQVALPVYLRSLERHQDYINPALERAAKSLAEGGYHVQVAHRPDTLDFFYHKPQRVPIVKNDGKFFIKNTNLVLTEGELVDFIKSNIRNLSPNVILRPQVQDKLFPTAAYVAGPSEVAYFGQFREVYDAFDNCMPVIYPRKSLTVLEKRFKKIIEKYRIRIQDVFSSPVSVEKEVLLSFIPEKLKNMMEFLRNDFYEKITLLENEASAFEPELKSVIRNLWKNVEKDLAHAGSKIVSSIERKNSIIVEQLSKLFINLAPGGALQERKLNALTYLYKYSHPFIYRLMEVTCCRHENNHAIWEVDF